MLFGKACKLLDARLLTYSKALDNSKRSQHQPQYLPIYESTRGIIFLGTPHRGSTAASWGILASNLAKVALQGPNEKILKTLKPNNELLENLHMVFLQMLEDRKIKIHSFYETQPMLGVYGLRDLVPPVRQYLRFTVREPPTGQSDPPIGQLEGLRPPIKQ